jgi:hypothetical protein
MKANWRKADDVPESYQPVLVYHAESIRMGFHDGRNWRVHDSDYDYVTHWCHLPDPPCS